MVSIFLTCVKNVGYVFLSNSAKFSRQLLQKILSFRLLCKSDLTPPLEVRATKQRMHDRNKIATERHVNNCDIRIDGDICTFFLMYENFRVGRTPPCPLLNPPVGVIVSTPCTDVRRHMTRTEELRRQTHYKKTAASLYHSRTRDN